MTTTIDDRGNTITTIPTVYKVCALPPDDDEFDSFTITVVWMGGDRWAVTRFGSCLGRDNHWTGDRRPDDRDDAWLMQHRFTMDEALQRAQGVAATIRVNGWTAHDVEMRRVSRATRTE